MRKKRRMKYEKYGSELMKKPTKKAKRTRINYKRVAILCLCVIGIIGGTIAACTGGEEVVPVNNTVNNKGKIQETTPTPTEKIEPAEVSIVAVGDDLVSDSVLYTCKIGENAYDFSRVYSVLKEDFQKADIAIINQETMLGGPNHEYQGYPNFNTPDAMGDAIIDAGFDIALSATNHSYDTGEDGIRHAIKYWKKHKNDITMIGLNKNEKEYNTIPIYECKGIKFAILNYTYGLNGYKLPQGKEYLVNLMDDEHWDKVKSDIEKAEELADFTIVFPHWGQEYVQPDPTDEQVKWANMMVESGADLIIGTHPHVIVKIDWITAENGNKALCYYSLGNYTSGQQQWQTLLGGMASLTIRKDENGTRILKKTVGAVPIVTHYKWGLGEGVVREQNTYKLKDYSDYLMNKHSIQWYDPVFVSDLENLAEQVFGKYIIK